MMFSYFKKSTTRGWILLVLLMSFLLSACEQLPEFEKQWEMIEKSGKNTVVNMYIVENAKAETIESWINDSVKSKLSQDENVELYVKRVPLDEVISLFREYKDEDAKSGKVDLIAVDEKSLQKLLKENYLYQEFAHTIFHVNKNISMEDLDVKFAEDSLLNGSAVPFNKETLLYCYNDDVIYDHPRNFNEFKELLENKRGIFTYPSAKTEIGFKFVKNVILNFVDSKEFLKDLTDEQLEALIKPAMDYLKEIEPYLYQKGSYLTRSDEYNDLYSESKIAIAISDNIRAFDDMVGESIYPQNTIAFSMGVNAGKNDYFVIPQNSTNKAGAMLVINEALDESLQSEKYANKHNIGISPYSHERLSKSTVESLNKVLKRRTFVKHSELISRKAHDIPTKYHEKIIEIWEKNFLKVQQPR